ncbi:25633_t:CDS:1, partial [Dentiscutata erythropus]
GKKRGPKSNSQSLSNINTCETATEATEALFSSSTDSSSFEIPHVYNHIIISSFFSFVHEGPTQN